MNDEWANEWQTENVGLFEVVKVKMTRCSLVGPQRFSRPRLCYANRDPLLGSIQGSLDLH